MSILNPILERFQHARSIRSFARLNWKEKAKSSAVYVYVILANYILHDYVHFYMIGILFRPDCVVGKVARDKETNDSFIETHISR